MDRVVSYDYPIDNNEEMKMGNFRIEDMQFDEAEVGSLTNREGTKIITIDFDPYDDGGVSIMHYTPDQARKLAAALILAAHEAEKR